MLVDDHRMFTEALTLLLSLEHGIEVVGSVETAEKALESCSQGIDVVLMDLNLPGMDGLSAIQAIHAKAPETKVVVVTASAQPEWIARAMQAGACGYVLKTKAPQELVQIITRAAAGEIVISPIDMVPILATIGRSGSVRSGVDMAIEELTAREIEILQLLAEGKPTAEVAQVLYISPLTVQTHVKSVLAKLSVHSKLEAVAYALRHRIVQIPQSA
jgi:DNA-binding NarL/FixJ family response regulator